MLFKTKTCWSLYYKPHMYLCSVTTHFVSSMENCIGIEYSLLFVFFWVIPRRLNFICRRFGTLCLFHLHRQVGV